MGDSFCEKLLYALQAPISNTTTLSLYIKSVMLKGYQIDYLLDVRSTPYSRYAAQFNRENLLSALSSSNIRYSFMGRYFGARPPETALYASDGCLDFDKVRESSSFKAGVKNVILGLSQGHNIALMCTEKNPMECHRAILVARAFALNDIYAKHILSNGELLMQQELDESLLQHYFPDRNQLTLFSEENEIDEQEYSHRAYKLRNKEIGYRIN